MKRITILAGFVLLLAPPAESENPQPLVSHDGKAQTGQADNTVIVYAADNGLALGSHALLGIRA